MKPYELKGQGVAKRAFEIARVDPAIGILLIGPLGSGKTTVRNAYPDVRSEEREGCLCGHFQDVRQMCKCSALHLARWSRRLERYARGFQIVLEAVPIPAREMMATNQNTPADDEYSNRRVKAAIDYGLTHTDVELSVDATRRMVEMATRRLSLTHGQYNAMFRVARAIANLDHSDKLQAKHVAEAVQYSAAVVLRYYDREYGRERVQTHATV